jgi:hypothetical protein
MLPKLRLSDLVSIRDINMYVWICLLAVTIFSNLQSVLDLADWVRLFTSRWLMIVEWFWRTIFGALGMPFYPEPAIVATVTLCTGVIAISAMMAEEPAPSPAGKAKRDDHRRALKAAFDAEWSFRIGHGVVSATVAIVVFVICIDGYVFGQSGAKIASNIPLIAWAFPAIAFLLYLPMFVTRGDIRNLALSIGSGVLLGALYSFLALPSALRSAEEGLSSIMIFRVVVLHYALIMLPYKFGCLCAMAPPHHLFRRLMFTGVALATLLLMSWVSAQQFSLKPPQQAQLQPSR